MIVSTYFGKICAIERSPSTVDEFNFWLARGCSDKVEVGYIVTAENKEKEEKVFGLVTNMKFFTDAESILVDYFSHEFGVPEAKAPTEREEVNIATAAVIGSSPYRARPMSGGLVRLATPEEIHKAYGMDQIKNRIFCGVITNGGRPDDWAPAYLDEKFLLGPEGAHINISGASGLATKTSAAVFLISSVLSAAKRLKKRYAVLAFNVKGGDLLRLNYGGESNEFSQEELLEVIKINGSPKDRKILEIAEENGVDMCFSGKKLKMFAPAKADDIEKPNSLVQKGVKPFYWALQDVLKEDAPVKLSDLFEGDDLDDKAMGVLASIEEFLEDEEIWKEKVSSFKELVHYMTDSVANKKKYWSKTQHHHSTIAKVIRHVRSNCKGILNGLFAYEEEDGKDVQIENINNGEVWVVDIEAINDKAKRLVFYNLTSRIAHLMEMEMLKPEKERRLHGVIVFVDELNKFAPSGALRNSRIKQQIIDVAARGRSLGVILFGAEQFASRVDKEVVGNTSSQLVGRTELLELEDRTYAWLSRNLRFIVGNLEKGRLLLRHATYGRPVFIKFPQPLYNLSSDKINEALERKTSEKKEKVTKEKEENEFEILRRLVKGKKGIHPVGIYDEVAEIRKLGVGSGNFVEWYKSWVGQGKLRGRGIKEKTALMSVIKYLKKQR